MPDRVDSFTHDGLTFDVHDSGPAGGPAVIALHGFPQSSACWSGVTPPLEQAGFRFLAPDQRGYSPGARPTAVEAYGLGPLASDVIALADAAGLDRFHLLGHDWGGMVAWHVAARYPERVRTLTVVSTPHPRAMIAAMPRGQALRSSYMAFFRIPRLPEWLFGIGGQAGLRWFLAAARHPDPRPVLELTAQPGAATAMINWYRALDRHRVPQPRMISTPTLYVWSDRDPALGRHAAEGTRGWVSGPYRFEILNGVSHWIPEERPAELANLLVEHLRAHPA